jgi:hypothetical protein
MVEINICMVSARLQLSVGSQIYATSNYFQYTSSGTTKSTNSSNTGIKGIILSASFNSYCALKPWPKLSTTEATVLINGIIAANRTLVLIDPDTMLTAGCQSYKQVNITFN